MANEVGGYLATITHKTSTSTAAAVEIARLTNVSLSASLDLIEVSNRDSTGLWRERMKGWRSWSGSAEFLFVDGNASQEDLFSALDGTKKTLTFYPGGSTGGGTNWSGTGFITSFEETGPNEEAVACNIEFEGTGGLTMST